jgi:hypothetical protein
MPELCTLTCQRCHASRPMPRGHEGSGTRIMCGTCALAVGMLYRYVGSIRLRQRNLWSQRSHTMQAGNSLLHSLCLHAGRHFVVAGHVPRSEKGVCFICGAANDRLCPQFGLLSFSCCPASHECWLLDSHVLGRAMAVGLIQGILPSSYTAAITALSRHARRIWRR